VSHTVDMSGFELLSGSPSFSRILTRAMSGACPGNELLPEVIVDGFHARGRHAKNLLNSRTADSFGSGPRRCLPVGVCSSLGAAQW
jgi:hypothetical protein